MGYTHYWSLKGKKAEIKRNLKQIGYWVNRIFQKYGDVIQLEDDDPRPPKMCKSYLRFNGKGSDGHETFFLPYGETGKYGFCKTNRKPYDVAVCAVLAVVQSYVDIELSSDGFSGLADETIVEPFEMGVRIKSGADGTWDEVVSLLQGWGFNGGLYITGIRELWNGVYVADYRFAMEPPPTPADEAVLSCFKKQLEDAMF